MAGRRLIFKRFTFYCTPARVAKLVDALSSGGSIRKVVLVRIQSRALRPIITRFFYASAIVYLFSFFS